MTHHLYSSHPLIRELCKCSVSVEDSVAKLHTLYGINVLFELSSVPHREDGKMASSPNGGRTFAIHVDGNDGYTCSPDRNYYYQIGTLSPQCFVRRLA